MDTDQRTPGLHIGRSWTGHDLEDNCPCPQAACGLIESGNISADCDQHPLRAYKSIRQGHRAHDCPMLP